MKKSIVITLLLLTFGKTWSQQLDTLTLHSEAFGDEREVYVHTPEFYPYQSDQVKNPVILLLDAQHEWFANPAWNTIRYLQFTHEIP